MKKYELERFDPEKFESSWKPKKDDNKVIVETAGFVPLEVKLKRFEEAGQLMQFNTQEFTSSDYRDLYLSPDFEIYPEDELEEIQEKIDARNQYIKELFEKKRRSKTSEVTTSEVAAAGSQKEGVQTSEPEEVQ